jgi:signal transduction histidine kinase
MNIRYKLTIQFTLIVASILLLFSLSIYYFSASYRDFDYNKRLTDRANTAAKLLLEVKEVDLKLQKIIDRNTLSLYEEKIYILGSNGNQIYSNVEDSVYVDSPILKEIKENGIIKFNEGARDVVGFLYRFDNQNYFVITSAYDIYGLSKLKNLKIVLSIGYLISLALTIVAGLFFAGRALKPISNVVEQVKKISISNLNLRVDEGNRKDEIAQMAITFNKMLQRLEEAFYLQRDFVSNAAHELRTPFTVMLAEIDYILLQVREKEKYEKILQNLSIELKRLSKLSNGLLDLARINLDNSNLELKTFRLDEVLLETRYDVLKTNSDYHVDIEFVHLPDDDSSLYVLGNAELIKIAIKNLIDNACKFSSLKSVKITFSPNEKHIQIDFIDKGIGIPREDMENIFQPFFRGKNTQFIAGYGLGLALTKKIVELHNGSIAVQSEVGMGSTLTLILPSRLNF